MICYLRLELKKRKWAKSEAKRNLAIQKSNLDLRQKYRIKVENKFEVLEGKEEIEELWAQLKKSFSRAIEEGIQTTYYNLWIEEERLRETNKNINTYIGRLEEDVKRLKNLDSTKNA